LLTIFLDELFDAAVVIVADLFGDKVAKRKPWWVQLLASLGCSLALGAALALPCVLAWLLWLAVGQ
jgi:hypothetical protein